VASQRIWTSSQRKKQNTIVRWFESDSEQMVENSSRDLARVLGIFEPEKLKPEMLINQVIRELESYKYKLFLFIFDNVFKDQMKLLPSFIANVSKNKVKVLITTRDSDLSN
jgi:hypothetical protein